MPKQIKKLPESLEATAPCSFATQEKTATPKRNQVHVTKSGEYAFAHVYFVQVFSSIIAFLQLCRSPRLIC